MQKTDRLEKRKTVIWLLVIYACSVMIRYLLALATRHYPTVLIDEFLYYSLGRSVATEGSLLYLGQPALYNYILYPLILSPVYLLFGQGADYYRLIQLWNIILMSLSVFPFYGLCKAMVRKEKTALWMTAIFMTLPQFILGEYIYSEAIIYPMFYTLIYCIYRNLKEDKIKYTIWIGILGTLLYYTKPGAVVPAVLALILAAGKAIKGKSRQAGIHVLAGLGCLAVSFFAIKLIVEQVFGYHGALLSVYDDQVFASKTYNMEYFFSSAAKYPYYFVLAGGILPLLVSVWQYPEYDREDKQYYWFLMICALVTMIGTAWMVNRPERKDMLYLRYVEMYLPVLYIYIMLPHEAKPALPERSGRAKEVVCWLILAYVAVCTFVWGATTGIGEQFDHHFLISLSVLFTGRVKGIANILIIFLAGSTLYLLAAKTEKQKLVKYSCMVLAAIVVINNIQAYCITAMNTDSKQNEETKAVYQRIGDKEYIHVYAEDQSDYGLDVYSRRNISGITDREFEANIAQNNGVYVPFIPASARGMTAVNQTPDVDMLIFDEPVHKRIKFSSDTYGFISEDNSFQIVSFTRGARIVDSVMDGDSLPTLHPGSACTLKIYKDEWAQSPVMIRLEIESQTDQDMYVTTDESNTFPLKEGHYWYQIELPEPAGEYTISVQSDDITIHNYEIISI